MPGPRGGVFRRRLSTHLEGHVDLLPGRRESFKQVARRAAALKQLSELRATNPQPPMASVLDLEDSLASECRLPSCIQREFRIRELEEERTLPVHPAIMALFMDRTRGSTDNFAFPKSIRNL
uniref:Uncharacterized protein n=1 Tax=Knipowitschia caucasica TaxID=637954 RepID=A0AAV2LVJ8_KNICA